MPKIKDLSRVDRPREKLEKYGVGKLLNAELLAILLGVGIKGTNVVELSKKILKKFPGEELANASVKDLMTINGLGTAKACEIVACFELGRRALQQKKSQLILSPKIVWEELRDIRDHKKEHFIVFYLDTRNQEIKRDIISVGTLNSSLIHPREVFEPAIQCSTAQVIIAHNHPSGTPEPSDEDIAVTRRLHEAGNILGIEVLDHVVVARDGYVSLREQGMVF